MWSGLLHHHDSPPFELGIHQRKLIWFVAL
jgi:hypothetical protein